MLKREEIPTFALFCSFETSSKVFQEARDETHDHAAKTRWKRRRKKKKKISRATLSFFNLKISKEEKGKKGTRILEYSTNGCVENGARMIGYLKRIYPTRGRGRENPSLPRSFRPYFHSRSPRAFSLRLLLLRRGEERKRRMLRTSVPDTRIIALSGYTIGEVIGLCWFYCAVTRLFHTLLA